MAERTPQSDLLYLRYERDVIVDERVEEFQAAVGEIAHEVFGDKNAVMMRTGQQDREVKPGYLAGYPGRAVGVQAALIYPARSLRLTQFEVLVHPEDRLEQELEHLWQASRTIIDGIPLASETMSVSCTKIDYDTQRGYEHIGEQAVLIFTGGDTPFLDEQNRMLRDEVPMTKPGLALTSSNDPLEPLVIPFGRLPTYRYEEQEEYAKHKADMATRIASYLPLMRHVELGRLKRRTAS